MVAHSFTTKAARAAYARGGRRSRRTIYREAFAAWRLELRNEPPSLDVGVVAARYAMRSGLNPGGSLPASYMAKAADYRRDRDKPSARFWIGAARNARLHPAFARILP